MSNAVPTVIEVSSAGRVGHGGRSGSAQPERLQVDFQPGDHAAGLQVDADLAAARETLIRHRSASGGADGSELSGRRRVREGAVHSVGQECDGVDRNIVARRACPRVRIAPGHARVRAGIEPGPVEAAGFRRRESVIELLTEPDAPTERALVPGGFVIDGRAERGVALSVGEAGVDAAIEMVLILAVRARGAAAADLEVEGIACSPTPGGCSP